MGKWNKTLMKGVDALIKLKVPVDKQFPGLQKFAADLDDAEELSDALLEMKKTAEALAKERDQKVAALKNLAASLNSKIGALDKAREQLERVMEKDDNEDGVEALKDLSVAMNQIEALTKDPKALKFDIQVK